MIIIKDGALLHLKYWKKSPNDILAQMETASRSTGFAVGGGYSGQLVCMWNKAKPLGSQKKSRQIIDGISYKY